MHWISLKILLTTTLRCSNRWSIGLKCQTLLRQIPLSITYLQQEKLYEKVFDAKSVQFEMCAKDTSVIALFLYWQFEAPSCVGKFQPWNKFTIFPFFSVSSQKNVPQDKANLNTIRTQIPRSMCTNEHIDTLTGVPYPPNFNKSYLWDLPDGTFIFLSLFLGQRRVEHVLRIAARSFPGGSSWWDPRGRPIRAVVQAG